MSKYYLSFKEFSAAVGISQQALYKAKKLKPYIIEIDGVKKIKKTALDEYKKENIQPLNNVEQPQENELCEPSEAELNNVDKPLSNLDRVLIDELKASYEARIEEQKSHYEARLQEKDDIIKFLKQDLIEERQSHTRTQAISFKEKGTDEIEETSQAERPAAEPNPEVIEVVEKSNDSTIEKPKGLWNKLKFAFSKD